MDEQAKMEQMTELIESLRVELVASQTLAGLLLELMVEKGMVTEDEILEKIRYA